MPEISSTLSITTTIDLERLRVFLTLHKSLVPKPFKSISKESKKGWPLEEARSPIDKSSLSNRNESKMRKEIDWPRLKLNKKLLKLELQVDYSRFKR